MKTEFYDIINRTEEKNWWYRVRRKIVRYAIIQNYKNIQGPPKILDIGCGVGAIIRAIEDLGQCYGVDNSQQAVDYCHQKSIANVSLGDINEIPFDEGSFDIVLALDVLEHVENDTGAIAEVRRVLRKGGVAIIFVPAFNFLWGLSDDLSRHFRRYSLGELKSKIEDNNLGIIRTTYFNTILFTPIWLTRTLLRVFKIKIQSENEMTPGLINPVLFLLFSIERVLLRWMNFPFGVSCMVVCIK